MRRSAALAGLSALAVPTAALAALAGCAPRSARKAYDAAPDARRSPGRPVHVVALGDSLVLGVGASEPRNGFVFRAYLRVLERRPGSRIDAYAIGGSTASDVLRLQAPRLAHVRADAVIICVGGNDVARRVEPDRFAQAYAKLALRVRALQPHAAIVCCGVPDVGLSPLFTGLDHAAVTELSRANDAAVRAAARRVGAAFADLNAAAQHAHGDANRFFSEDRFHPSDAGYAELADVLAPVLLRALGD